MDKKPKKRPSSRRTKTQISNRHKLEKATADYFDSLSGEALEEEKRLEAAIASASNQVNFDEDY